jgi:diguanylate cyclase (GGDEF)-like protein
MSQGSLAVTAIEVSHPLPVRDEDHRRLADAGQVAGLLERVSGLEEQNRALRILNQQLQLNAEYLAKQAFVDALTGLGNRRYIDSAIDLATCSTSGTGRPLALLLCDIDSFKHYNDAYGHGHGDAVLVRIAAALRMFCRRQGDRAGRYGGDEFALLLPELDSDGAVAAAERLRMGVADLAIGHRETPLERVTITIGVTTIEGRSPRRRQQLLEAADEALYRAKRGGRNRTEYQSVSEKI